MPETCPCITGTLWDAEPDWGDTAHQIQPIRRTSSEQQRGREGRISALSKLRVCLCTARSEQNTSPSPPFNVCFLQTTEVFTLFSLLPCCFLLATGWYYCYFFLNQDSPACVSAQAWLHTRPRKSAFLFSQFFFFFLFHSLSSPNWSFQRLDNGKKEDLERISKYYTFPGKRMREKLREGYKRREWKGKT